MSDTNNKENKATEIEQSPFTELVDDNAEASISFFSEELIDEEPEIREFTSVQIDTNQEEVESTEKPVKKAPFYLEPLWIAAGVGVFTLLMALTIVIVIAINEDEPQLATENDHVAQENTATIQENPEHEKRSKQSNITPIELSETNQSTRKSSLSLNERADALMQNKSDAINEPEPVSEPEPMANAQIVAINEPEPVSEPEPMANAQIVAINKLSTNLIAVQEQIAKINEQYAIQQKDLQNNSVINSETQKHTEKLITKLSKQLDTQNSAFKIIEQRLNDMNAQIQTNKEMIHEQSNSILNKERLLDFNIVDVSKEGDKAIVQTPSNNTIVLFNGEFVKVGTKTLQVSDVANGGWIVHLGDRYFIDKKRVPRDAGNRIAIKNNPIEVNQAEAAEAQKKLDEASVLGTDTQVLIPGYQAVAIFDQEILIQTPDKSFITLKFGDNLTDYGIIKSVAPEQDKLFVGDNFYLRIQQ